MPVCGNDYSCELVRKLGLTGFWGRTVQFLLNRPLKIFFIVIVAAVVGRVLARLARRTVEALAGAPAIRRTSGRADQRIRTLAGVSGSVVRVLVWTVALLIALATIRVSRQELAGAAPEPQEAASQPAASQPAASQPGTVQRHEDRAALAAAARPCRFC